MKKSGRLHFRVSENDTALIKKNMEVRGFTRKADYIRYLIREDNPYVNSLREVVIDLKLDVKRTIKQNAESQFDAKKLAFLNYKTLMLLLSYFADEMPSQEAIEKVKQYVAEREKEFKDWWRKKNRKM